MLRVSEHRNPLLGQYRGPIYNCLDADKTHDLQNLTARNFANRLNRITCKTGALDFSLPPRYPRATAAPASTPGMAWRMMSMKQRKRAG